MALLDFEVPAEFIQRWKRMAAFNDWHIKVLQIGADIFAENLRRELVLHYHTGDLLDAIKVQKPKRDKDGYCSVSVYDKRAPSTNGTRNALKLAELEYGNSNQRASPVVALAKEESKPQFEEAAIDYLSEYWGS